MSNPYYKVRRLYWFHIKHPFKRWFGRKWELLHTPKDQRPVKKLLWKKLDEAQEQMASELGKRLYGFGTADFDGLGSIVDDGVNVTDYDELVKAKHIL